MNAPSQREQFVALVNRVAELLAPDEGYDELAERVYDEWEARGVRPSSGRAERAILAAADALRDGDPQEAYHQLYGYADPTYTETADPFEKLRAALSPSPPQEKP